MLAARCTQRTLPLGAVRLSGEFLSAAQNAQEPAKTSMQELAQRLSLVAYYLVGHSIELSLKAFLLGRGLTWSILGSRKYGHNLSALLAECRRRKLGTCVKLSTREMAVVQVLNDCYSAKELEYSFTGSRRLPNYSQVVQLATKLHDGIAPYCGKLAANNSFKPKALRDSA